MIDVLKYLLEYGAIGVVAALALLGYFSERKKNDALHAKIEANVKEHAAEISAIKDKLTISLQEAEKLHRVQEDELVERLLKIAERVATLGESIDRRR